MNTRRAPAPVVPHLRLLIVLAAATPALRAADDPARFLDVPEWNGFLRVRGSGSGSLPGVDGSSYDVTVSADLPLRLAGTPGVPINVQWSGCVTNPTAELRSRLEITCPGGRTEATVTGSAPFLDLGGGQCPGVQLAIFPPPLQEGSGQLTVPMLAFNATERFLSDCPDTDETFEGIPVTALPGDITDVLGSVPLPEEGLLIEASWTISEPFFLSAVGAYGTIEWQVDLQLSGEAQDLEVVVVFDDEDYATWLPQADFEERTEGNWIRFHAELRRKDGTPTLRRASSFIFELPQVSNEPGVCLNWPDASIAIRAPDLQFLRSRNPGPWQLNGSRDVTRMETASGEYTISPVATLSCFDWGAFGTLKAYAVLVGGETLEGHLEGEEETTAIPVPRREQGSRIASAWKSKAGVSRKADDADDETRPSGDGDAGDGFTLYEEYRGFYLTEPRPDDHVEGDPLRKDLFVQDTTASGAAINRFARLSGLRVHGKLQPPFLDSKRVVNFNGAGSPNHNDQHALVIERGPLERGVGGVAEGGPGLPKSVSKITLSETLDPRRISTVVRDGYSRSRSPYTSTLVHEIFHGCNVYHHGSGDVTPAVWLITDNADGTQTITEGGRTIEVYLENGLKVTFTSPGVRRVYLGVQGGQHSGVEDCVMRYDVAIAHTANGSASRRYIGIDELVGDALCSSSGGTGVNAVRPFNRPIRYGDAEVGCCSSQTCVNDRQSHAAGAGSSGCGGGGGVEDEAAGEAGAGGGVLAEPALEISLSANGARALTVYPGDPVLFIAELALAPDSPPDSTLTVAAPGERWTRWIRLERTEAGGGESSWPAHLATEAGPELVVTEEVDGIAGWWTRPDETAGLAPGVYQARVELDTGAAAAGWSGTVRSLPVRLEVVPLPAPVPDELARERALRLARYRLAAADLPGARQVIEEILRESPSSPAGLALEGALRSAEGDPAGALDSFQAAIDAAAALDPDADEPPVELLRAYRETFAQSGLVAVEGEPRFRRGDPNQDGLVDIADAVVILFQLFRGAPAELVCAKSADIDDNGRINLTDAVALLRYLFLGQAAPPQPFGACGTDPTADGLACTNTPECP